MKAQFFLAALAGSASAFFAMPCPSRLLEERADPIVDAGKISSHVHTISGGSGFALNTTYQRMRESACTSCAITEDLSAYWTPKLYYHAENGSFLSIPQNGDGAGGFGGHTVYYLQRPGPDNDKLHAFPEGFRMLAGDPMKRNYTDDFASDAVSYLCLGTNPPSGPVNGFPNHNCPGGLRLQIFFPSCWDGVNLDSPDHKSHMSYPIDGAYNGGRCPDTHPVHLISIFFEVVYLTQNFADDWYGDKQPFVLANGDDTGYGYHGDFINGWDVDVLQKAVDTCNNNSGRLQDCDAFTLQNYTTAQSCKLPSTIDEQIQGPLEALPGCNPIQSGPAPAMKKIAGCVDHATIGVQESFHTDKIDNGWMYAGCGTDNVSERTLTEASQDVKTQTVESCIEFCDAKGYSYAGLEYGTQCFCGNDLPEDRAPRSDILGNCRMPCAGDAGEICGGGSALSIYHKCSDDAECANYVFSGITNGTTTN